MSSLLQVPRRALRTFAKSPAMRAARTDALDALRSE